jgi:hypothetical protein
MMRKTFLPVRTPTEHRADASLFTYYRPTHQGGFHD